MVRCDIISTILDKEVYHEIFDKYKNYIPDKFKKEYGTYGDCLRLPLLTGSNEFDNAISDLNRAGMHEGIQYRVFRCVKYTKKEIEQSEYFEMSIGYPLELEGKDASDYGTKYNFTCSQCGIRSDPVGNVLVNKTFLKKIKIGNLSPDIIIAEDIMELFKSAGFSGITFGNKVLDYKGREMEPFYTMNINNVLPPMASGTYLFGGDSHFDNHRHTCDHNAYYLQSDIQYERYKLKDALDFNLTCEYLDNWRLRYIVVKANVRDFVISNNLRKNIGFFPVAIV